MATEEEVEMFLAEFKAKLLIRNVLYSNRAKNAQTLLDLDIKPIERTTFLKELELTDFSQGPLPDTMVYEADMWVFGITIKSKEVYIKITMGKVGLDAICISFHIAEYPMKYPFKI